MKERPILFSGAMVRAILAGTKTQTRRVVKGQALDWLDNFTPEFVVLPENNLCPYGQPGDRLWVRENFQPLLADGFEPYEADWETGWGYAPRHVATDGAVEFIDMDDNISSRVKPSIHMPRWASRLTLEITGVRVERLQDISEGDAIAEGIERGNGFPGWYRGPLAGDSPGLRALGFKIPTAFPKLAYRALWESINGPGSWAADPWVWAVEFKKLEAV